MAAELFHADTQTDGRKVRQNKANRTYTQFIVDI